MRAVHFLIIINIVVTALSPSLQAQDSDAVSTPAASTARIVRGPCLTWFLFFCLNRSTALVGYNPDTEHDSGRDSRGQAFEPAMTAHLGDRGAPIMSPFIKAFNACAPGCTYTSWGIWGDKRHQQRKSCHNSGSAIDIHAIKCNGQTHAGGTGSARFLEFRSCIHGRDGLYTIHGKGDHKNHIDIAIADCQLRGVGKVKGLQRR